MNIYYGVINNKIDITQVCIDKLKHNNIIEIPCGDNNRAIYFTDPLSGIHKKYLLK